MIERGAPLLKLNDLNLVIESMIGNQQQPTASTASIQPTLTVSSDHNRAVFDRLNMAFMDENSILDQIYQKQTFLDFYYKDLKILRVIEENACLKKYSTL